jgi:peptide/nickel transport system permease protein
MFGHKNRKESSGLIDHVDLGGGKVRSQDSPHGERWRRVSRIIRRSPLTIVGVLIVLVFIVMAIFAPYLAPYPEDATGQAMNLEAKLQRPSLNHPLGTDDLGRDMLSRIFYGCRLSLGLGIAVVVVTAILGTAMGCIAGYFGGKVDEVIMRLGDILMAIPYMLLVIAIVVATGRGLEKLIIAISLPWWPWYARVVRGEVVRIRETTFVDAARALGASNPRIIFVHILPNVLNVIIVQASLQIGRAILAVAAMGFLGLGVQPPHVEWGLLVSVGRTYMPTWWWMASFPGASIFLLGLGFNFLGDGLRDIMDPRGLT